VPLEGSEIRLRQTPRQLRRRQYRRVGFRLFLLVLVFVAVAWGLITSGQQHSAGFYTHAVTHLLRYVLGPLAIALLLGFLIYKGMVIRRNRHEYSMANFALAAPKQPQNAQQQFNGCLDVDTHQYDIWEVEAVVNAELSVSVGVMPTPGTEFPQPTSVDLYIEKPDQTAYHNYGTSGAFLSIICTKPGIYRVILTSSMAKQMRYVLMITYNESKADYVVQPSPR